MPDRSDNAWVDHDAQDLHDIIADGDTSFAFDIPVHVEADSPPRDQDSNSADGPGPPNTKSSNRNQTGMKGKRASTIQKKSRHGTQYPSLPRGLVKNLAASLAQLSGHRKAVIDKEALGAVMQASDWFFEQLSDDLSAYAGHASRRMIDETDILALMKRSIFSTFILISISDCQ